MDAEGISLAAFVQDGIYVRGGSAQSRQDADHQTSEERGGGGKSEDAPIEGRIYVERKALQVNRAGPATDAHSEKHPGAAAQNREQDAFGEHLADEPRASRMFSTFMQVSSKTKAARTRNKPETAKKKLLA